MAGIMNFRDRKEVQEEQENITLNDWLNGKSEDEIRSVFLRMDATMKYIHDKGYCIKTFNPREIELINGSPNKIKYNVLLEMPKKFEVQKELVREDIYNATYLHIGVYTKCLDKNIKPAFLKENFDEFATFLPSSDIPYYRGIIERGASVYFTEFDRERSKRELTQLEEQVGANEVDKGKALVKGNGLFKGTEEDKINNNIYKQIDNKEAAFVSFLIFPTIVLFLGLMVAIVAWIASLS